MSRSARPRPRRRTPSKRNMWLLLAAGVVVLLGAAAAVWVLAGAPKAAPNKPSGSAEASATSPASAETTETTSTAPTAGTGRTDDGSLVAAQQVAIDFYAALNAHDPAKVQSLLTPDMRATVDASTVQSWQPNVFTFVRSAMAGADAAVYGREKIDAYGSPAPGGVKLAMTRIEGAWYIADLVPADQGTVTGQPPATTSGGGVKGAITDKTARAIVTQLLQARQKGDGAAIRKLTTAKFQQANGDAWLDGVDNTTYFTKFVITSVKVSGATASVVVSETWPDGTAPSTYGLVDQNGSVFVDTWQP